MSLLLPSGFWQHTCALRDWTHGGGAGDSLACPAWARAGQNVAGVAEGAVVKNGSIGQASS